MSSRIQTFTEEMANASTHGIGIAFAIAATFLMISLAHAQQSDWKLIASIIFGGSLIITYSVSTIYHAVQHPKHKAFWRTADHATIFILIAGTYAPFCLVALLFDWGLIIFIVMWSAAIVGIFFEFLFKDTKRAWSLGMYFVMGWAVVFAIKPLLNDVPYHGLLLLLAGGLCYTLGIIFYAWQKLLFNHAVWHVFVLAGSVCHFFAVLFYILPVDFSHIHPAL